jgi:hypothetical protein
MLAPPKPAFLFFHKIVLLIGLGLVMLSCSPAPVDLHRDRKPALSLEEFFEGNTVAYGIFENRYGNLERQFRVNIMGTVDGDTLILDEQFLYDDGERSSRVWTITNLGEQPDGSITYRGVAADVIGEANGKISGNALNWIYDVDLAVGDGTIKMRFDDWIYRQDDNIAINRAYISKFGINIGSVTLVFLKGELADQVFPLDLQTWPQ